MADRMIGSLRRAALTLLLACLCGGALAERSPEWAQPVDLGGVPDMYQISPLLFRSAQPTAAGMQALDELGIRTVINLCGYHDDSRLLAGTRLREVRIPIGLREIGDAEIVAVLRKLRRAKEGPFLIHCRGGADQTGLVAAMYRIVVQGWDKERAIEEMTRGGFDRHGVRRSIVRYIRHVDVARVRAEVEKS